MRASFAFFGLVAMLLGAPTDGVGPAAATLSSEQATDLAETLALARRGDARAQFLAASAFARGEGVEFDPVEASEWYHRAAAQGLPEAQYALGVVYSEGRGVYRDSAEAYFWCHLAASQAYPEAAACRDGIAQGLSSLRLSAVKERLRNWRPRPGAVPLEGSTAEAWPDAALAVSEPGQADPETHDTPNEDDTVSEIENFGNARAGSADSEISVGNGTTTGEPHQKVAVFESSSDLPAVEAAAELPGAGATAHRVAVETVAAAGAGPEDRTITAIHLASIRTKDAAEQEWGELQRRFPKLLAEKRPIVRSVDLAGQGTYFRVMAGPFEDRAAAQRLCDVLARQGQYCSPAPLREESAKKTAPSATASGDARRAAFAAHLLSAKTESRAESSWLALQQQFPGSLGDKSLTIRTIDVAGEGRFYRVLAGPFANRDEAQKLCAGFKADEQYCSVVDLTGDRLN